MMEQNFDLFLLKASMTNEQAKALAKTLFWEDKEHSILLFERVFECSEEELAIYLTSSCEEERWLAQWRISLLKS